MQLEGSPLSIEEACAAAQVSRAGYYRYFDEHRDRNWFPPPGGTDESQPVIPGGMLSTIARKV